MGTITIPNRPSGSSVRSIAQILANFDAITTEANGNLDQTNIKSDGVGTSQRAAVPFFKLGNVAGQGISHNTKTDLLFDNEEADAFGMHDNATNKDRVVIGVAGKWLLIGNCAWPANATGIRRLAITKGATTGLGFDERLSTGSSVTTPNLAVCVADLAVNDIIRVSLYQNSGVTLTPGLQLTIDGITYQNSATCGLTGIWLSK